MRLWHEDLIPKLPDNQIGGQWRECIALLGNGWGKKHKTVNYVFDNDTSLLIAYTMKVYMEMIARGRNANQDLIKEAMKKRGLSDVDIASKIDLAQVISTIKKSIGDTIYLEHNDSYLQECLDNLKKKGIELDEEG
jgi:uncharacterized protein (TIGR02328 family)